MAETASRFPLAGLQPRQRRLASVGSTVAAVALLGFAVIAVLFQASQAQTFLLAILAVLLVLLVVQALVVVSGMRASSAAAAPAPGPTAWQESYAPPPVGAPPEAPQVGQPITLKCSNCGTVFDVADTGARPLRHVCPGCGSEGVLTEEDIGPAAVPSEVAAPAPAPAAPQITLKCGNCGTIFDVADTGERPLHHVCPGCGSEGVLREEDLGPPPAPAAPAPAPAAKPAARPASAGARKTVKTLKLRCKNCSTVFTLRDTGERPLYHECPGCKATGVLR
jgi:predicted  nucleic acid-binding Zn-ribbon protein